MEDQSLLYRPSGTLRFVFYPSPHAPPLWCLATCVLAREYDAIFKRQPDACMARLTGSGNIRR